MAEPSARPFGLCRAVIHILTSSGSCLSDPEHCPVFPLAFGVDCASDIMRTSPLPLFLKSWSLVGTTPVPRSFTRPLRPPDCPNHGLFPVLLMPPHSTPPPAAAFIWTPIPRGIHSLRPRQLGCKVPPTDPPPCPRPLPPNIGPPSTNFEIAAVPGTDFYPSDSCRHFR